MVQGDRTWNYYGAVLASTISTLSWIGALLIGIYITFLIFTGETSDLATSGFVVAIATGISFALLEKRLYRVEPDE